MMTKYNSPRRVYRDALLIIGLLALAGCSASQWESKTTVSKVNISPETRTCPDWSADPVSNYSNEDFSNLGCSTTNNLYVQLRDKNDYKRGSGKPAIHADRESAVLQNYLTGAGSGASSSADAAPSTSR